MALDRSRWFPLLSFCSNLVGSKQVPNCPFTVWAEAFSHRELKLFFVRTRTALGRQSFWWRFRREFWAYCTQDSLNKMLEAFNVSWQQSLKRRFAEKMFLSSPSVVCDAVNATTNFSQLRRDVVRVVLFEIVDKDRNFNLSWIQLKTNVISVRL